MSIASEGVVFVNRVLKVGHTFSLSEAVRTADGDLPFTATFDVCNEFGEVLLFRRAHGQAADEVLPFMKTLAKQIGSEVLSPAICSIKLHAE